MKRCEETCHEFVERVWGRPCTKEEVEVLLWHCTAFPCVDVEYLEKQLIEIRERSGGDFEKAWKLADQDIGEAMKGLPK